VRGLQKRSRRTAGRNDVDNLDLDVEPGEIVALLGQHGSQATLLGILAGRMHRDGGYVRVLGSDPEHAGASWRSSIGVVASQRAHRLPHTARELVRETARWHRAPRDPDEVLYDLGLRPVRHVPARALSPDQQRCLDVALAVVGRPQLLLLDGPTRGLGTAATRDIHAVVRSVRAAGTTVVLSTSSPEEARLLADRAVVLAGGRCLALDGPGRPDPGSAAVRLSWTCGGVVLEVYGGDPAELATELAHDPAGGASTQLLGATA